MNGQLFRKKSIERVSSPEQLDEYIRVSNPGIWIVLAAIVILLIGVCVWGVVGHLDTRVSAVAISENGQTMVYIKEAEAASVQIGIPVEINGETYTVTEIAEEPAPVNAQVPAYALHVGDLQNGEWVFTAKLDRAPADGIYPAELIVESVSPMHFVLN